MENQYSNIFTNIVTLLVDILDNDNSIYSECKNLYSQIIKLQFALNTSDRTKIEVLLTHCSEYILQNLWLTFFKSCQIKDALNIFKSEILCRDFQNNLWCQEVLLNNLQLASNDTSLHCELEDISSSENIIFFHCLDIEIF